MFNIGAVIIGRNEGERLRACLKSVLKQTDKIVYVDSGSTDGSVELAKSMGVDALPLDPSKPFCAARGRNEGFALLMSRHPEIEFVQFLDGDAVMVDTWMPAAVAALRADEKVAVVSGRRREIKPEQSVFTRICDIEWNKALGKSQACEGDALMRPHAFAQVNGFNSALIAGEEPELCERLRAAGWDILRIHDEMSLHDVGMVRLSQWWKREARAGHAYAEWAANHGMAVGLRRSLGICLWGGALPFFAVALAWPTRGLSLAVWAVMFLLLVFRAWKGTRMRADSTRHAIEYAFWCAVGKFPSFQGLVRYWRHHLTGKDRKLIEYKQPAATAVPAAE